MSSNRIRSAFRQLFERWRDYRAAIAELRALERIDPDMVARIAAENGLSVDELRDIVMHGSSADGLMTRMMQAHDLDPDELRRQLPSVIRDVERVCAACRAKGRCEHELDAGTAARDAPDFCPNAKTFEALAESRHG